ncbi:MAG: hypothetical protein EOP34_09935, partial [Rickettsiales bacterium]
LINLMNGGDVNSKDIFSFIDKIMSATLFEKNALLRIIALLFTSPAGIFFFIAFMHFMLEFCIVTSKIVVSYILGFLYSGIMIMLAPIFIPCFLFSKTKHIFDNWLKYMIKYTIEPIILIFGLNVISSLMIQNIYNIYNSWFCYKCTIKFDIGVLLRAIGMDLPESLTTAFCLDWFQPWGYDNFNGGFSASSFIIGKFPYIIFMIVLTKILSEYIEFVDTLLRELTNTRTQEISNQSTQLSGRQEGGTLTDAVHGSVLDSAKSLVGMDDKSVERRNYNYKLDRAIKAVQKEGNQK